MAVQTPQKEERNCRYEADVLDDDGEWSPIDTEEIDWDIEKSNRIVRAAVGLNPPRAARHHWVGTLLHANEESPWAEAASRSDLGIHEGHPQRPRYVWCLSLFNRT